MLHIYNYKLSKLVRSEEVTVQCSLAYSCYRHVISCLSDVLSTVTKCKKMTAVVHYDGYCIQLPFSTHHITQCNVHFNNQQNDNKSKTPDLATVSLYMHLSYALWSHTWSTLQCRDQRRQLLVDNKLSHVLADDSWSRPDTRTQQFSTLNICLT